MNKLVLSICYLLLIPVINNVFSQNSLELNGDTYINRNDKWYVVDKRTGTEFEVIEEEISVKFNKDAGSIDSCLNYLSLKGILLKEIRRNILRWVDFEVPEGITVFELYSKLSNIEIIERIQIGAWGKWCYSPNDTHLEDQWYIDKIQAKQAWDYTGGDKNIRVAILDQGAELGHEDLGWGTDSYQNIWLNGNEDAWSPEYENDSGNKYDDDQNGFVDDWKGWDFYDMDNESQSEVKHGTLIAGIVAAKTNNGKGISGIAGGKGDEGVKL